MKTKLTLRNNRKSRIRKRISGTPERPRLTVFKSNKHLTLQVIDDMAGKTLVSVNTVEKDFRAKFKSNNMKTASEAGVLLAQRAKEKGISKMVFDRNGYVYHGRVKKIAESLRENGIQI